MVRPEVQNAREHAAPAGLFIGVELPLGYWFYSYLTWCYSLIIAIIQARSDHEAADTSAHGVASARPRPVPHSRAAGRGHRA